VERLHKLSYFFWVKSFFWTNADRRSSKIHSAARWWPRN